MSAHHRSRLVSTIAREVARILEFEVKDPALRMALPTVMGVRLSPDREEAVVAVAVQGGVADVERVRAALVRDRGFIRTQLAHRLSMRRVPRLTFVLAEPRGFPLPPSSRDG
ncbi:30S ribosome-binding factor RbfA [Candidatus Bipolaricaulota bacterium]|nr:30S ribosome-binding factor RbfA [Candidatus Bipolaricaulota bacterium]